jgi:hypothetical protein
MHGEQLFLIPIYHRSMDKHADIMNEKKKKFISENMVREQHLQKEEYEAIFDKSMRLPWQYSQIVGFVEINIEFNDLKSYYWFVSAKRVSYLLKDRTMEYRGKLSDVSKLNRDNEVIRRDIRDFISKLPSLRRQFKNRHFDTRALFMILNAVDFKNLKQHNF